MPKYDVAPQGSAGWLKARLGHLCASRMNDALAITKKGEPSEVRTKYQYELLAERMTGMAVDRYVTPQMMRGQELEPVARDLYEQKTGRLVMQVGFCVHDTIEYLGASSDGIVNEGMIEVKCFNTPDHLAIITRNEVPEKVKNQMITQCLVLDKPWVDYVGFDDRVPEPLQLFVKRYEPTKAELDRVKDGAVRFLDELEKLWDILITRGDI